MSAGIVGMFYHRNMKSYPKKDIIVLSRWKIAWLQSWRDYLIRAFLSLNVVSAGWFGDRLMEKSMMLPGVFYQLPENPMSLFETMNFCSAIGSSPRIPEDCPKTWWFRGLCWHHPSLSQSASIHRRLGSLVSYNAAVSACVEGRQWQMALQLLVQAESVDVITLPGMKSFVFVGRCSMRLWVKIKIQLIDRC